MMKEDKHKKIIVVGDAGVEKAAVLLAEAAEMAAIKHNYTVIYCSRTINKSFIINNNLISDETER